VVNILEKFATGYLFQNYVSAGSLIIWLIKYLLTVWVVMEHSNQVVVGVFVSVQTQNLINPNFFIESMTSRIVFKNFDCNSSVFFVGCVPTFGLSATTQ
jgi:hypothetical protein